MGVAQALGDRADARHEFVGGEDAVGEAEALRAFGVDLVGQQVHLACAGESDEAGEGPGAAEVAGDADVEEGGVEVGGVGHVAEVGGEGD